MCEAIILIRYEIWLPPEQNSWPAWLDEQWNKVWAALSWFDANPLQLADPINISHLALGCALGYLDFRFPDTDWPTRHPNVHDWYQAVNRRPSFATTRPVSPPNPG